MELEKTEQEQIEALRSWWKENWLSLVGGLILGLGGILGWQYYGDWKHEQAASASERFERVAQLTSAGQLDQAAALLDELNTHNPTSPYVAHARLSLAQAAVEAEQWSDAVSYLQPLVKDTRDPAVTGLARLRMARVHWQQGQLDAALTTLDADMPAPFKALADELRGDIARAKGDVDQARMAYETALASDQDVLDRATVERKLSSLN